MLRIDFNDLAFGIGRTCRQADADVAGKNVPPVVVQHRIHVDSFALLQGKLRDLSAVAEDVRPFIKENRPAASPKDSDNEVIANAVYIGDYTTHHRCDSRR